MEDMKQVFIGMFIGTTICLYVYTILRFILWARNHTKPTYYKPLDAGGACYNCRCRKSYHRESGRCYMWWDLEMTRAQ
jgi:hypothetical protein